MTTRALSLALLFGCALVLGACWLLPGNGTPTTLVNWRLNALTLVIGAADAAALAYAGYYFWRHRDAVAVIRQAADRLHALIGLAEEQEAARVKRWDDLELSLQAIRLSYLREVHAGTPPEEPSGADAPG